MSSLQGFRQGFSFITHGWRLLGERPQLFKWLIIPVIIDFILMILGIAVVLSNVGEWATLITLKLISVQAGFWYFVLYYPLLLLMALTASVAVFYAVFVLSSVVAAPFYAVLVEKILVLKKAKPDRPFQFGQWLRLSIKMLWVSLLKAIVFLFLGIILFLVSFIPGFNLISIYLAFLIIAFDCMDYTFEAMEMGFASRIHFFKKNLREFSGMSALLSLSAFIPGLTLLLLPLAVTGAADLFVRLQQSGSKQ